MQTKFITSASPNSIVTTGLQAFHIQMRNGTTNIGVKKLTIKPEIATYLLEKSKLNEILEPNKHIHFRSLYGGNYTTPKSTSTSESKFDGSIIYSNATFNAEPLLFKLATESADTYSENPVELSTAYLTAQNDSDAIMYIKNLYRSEDEQTYDLAIVDSADASLPTAKETQLTISGTQNQAEFPLTKDLIKDLSKTNAINDAAGTGNRVYIQSHKKWVHILTFVS